MAVDIESSSEHKQPRGGESHGGAERKLEVVEAAGLSPDGDDAEGLREAVAPGGSDSSVTGDEVVVEADVEDAGDAEPDEDLLLAVGCAHEGFRQLLEGARDGKNGGDDEDGDCLTVLRAVGDADGPCRDGRRSEMHGD